MPTYTAEQLAAEAAVLAYHRPRYLRAPRESGCRAAVHHANGAPVAADPHGCTGAQADVGDAPSAAQADAESAIDKRCRSAATGGPGAYVLFDPRPRKKTIRTVRHEGSR